MVNDECHTGQQYSSRDLISVKYTRSKWNGETPLRLRTRKMCSLFDALVTISLMCKSHFRLFWIVKPNTLWDSILSRLMFSTTKAGGGCSISRRKETIISLHFLGFNFILLVLVQLPIASKSYCSVDTSLVGTFSDIVTSSTYFQLLERGDTNHYDKKDWTQFGTLWDPSTSWKPSGHALTQLHTLAAI